MAQGQLLTDELALPDAPAQTSHPMDSSRILLGLTRLCRKARAAQSGAPGSDSLDGVISRSILRSLLSTLHYRDAATIAHSRRVAMLAAGMAQYLGWEGRNLRLLEVSALLHDVGKIGVPDNILFKPAALNADEADLMDLHRSIGLDVLQASCVDDEVLEIVRQAHDFFDGATDGYRRLGDEVHQGARILSVADAYDSMATDQVYRAAKPHAEIIGILQESSGTQFDGNVVAALTRWIDQQGLPAFENAAESVQSSQPRSLNDPEEVLEATSFCHILAYLYLLESLYDGFYLVNSNLEFVIWNRGAEKLLGHPASDMLGHGWTSRILRHANNQGDPLSDRDCPLRQVIQTRKPATTQVQLQHWDGTWINVELQSVPLFDEEGQLQGVAEIFRNLSRDGRNTKVYRDLKLAASRDALTSLANRGELESQLARVVADWTKQDNPESVGIVFLDVDHFKKINDTFGHKTGDEVLIGVSKLLQQETYSGELVARFGGEEFVLLCPGISLEDTVKRADRLRLALCQLKIPALQGDRVTASFGVTAIEAGDSVDTLVQRADQALYRAKESGRNRTCFLTNTVLAEEASEAERKRESKTKSMMHTGTFHACVTSDMIIYKLAGFVDEHRAKLLDVTPERVTIRVGSRGLLPYWGATDERRPVHLTVEFGAEQISPAATNRKSATRRTAIHIEIRPLGWIKDEEIFQHRAKGVMKDLRSFFAAD